MQSDNKHFSLNYRFGLFPLRFLLFAVASVIVTSLITGLAPSFSAFIIIVLIALLIIMIFGLLNSIFSRLSLVNGIAATWGLGVMVCIVVYFLLPLINIGLAQFSQSLPAWLGASGLPQEQSLPYFIVLGLFVLPLTLTIEQLLHVRGVLESEKESSEVKDLDMRIRPHFLFNSLNSVAGLIHSDPDTAEHGLMDLADMFRIIMTDKRKNVPISAELDMARKYVSLEKIRLGKRLKVLWELKDLDKSINLPILTLQPLIENAIYHGIETRLKGGIISIKARNTPDYLFISIINPRPEANAPVRKGNQVAQENLRNRIEIAYGGAGSINLMETEKFYTVTLKLPRTLSTH